MRRASVFGSIQVNFSSSISTFILNYLARIYENELNDSKIPEIQRMNSSRLLSLLQS